jgi:hypothetical protein
MNADLGDIFSTKYVDRLMQTVIVQRYRPAIHDWIPVAWRQLLTSCWSNSPEERPSLDEIIAELESIQHDDAFDAAFRKYRQGQNESVLSSYACSGEIALGRYVCIILLLCA